MIELACLDMAGTTGVPDSVADLAACIDAHNHGASR